MRKPKIPPSDKDEDSDGLIFEFTANIKGRLGKESERIKWIAALGVIAIVVSALCGFVMRIVGAFQ